MVRAKELFTALDSGQDLATCAAPYPPILVPDRIDVIKILGVLRKAKGSLVLVVDEYGTVQGLVTPLDILEAIAGEFPDSDETPDIVREGVNGASRVQRTCISWSNRWAMSHWSVRTMSTRLWLACCWRSTSVCPPSASRSSLAISASMSWKYPVVASN